MVETIPPEGISLIEVKKENDALPAKRKPLVGAAAAWLADPDIWANYENDLLVEVEEMLRAWLEEMCKLPAWKTTNAKCRRYTFSMVFELVTGERYVQKKHMCQVHVWTTLLKYYSSRVQKSASINGKLYNKTVYNLSPKRFHTRPPYSVRLRIPWLIEHGYTINKDTMLGVSNDLIEPGHARNPRTEANMKKRREEGRKRYAETCLSKERRAEYKAREKERLRAAKS